MSELGDPAAILTSGLFSALRVGRRVHRQDSSAQTPESVRLARSIRTNIEYSRSATFRMNSTLLYAEIYWVAPVAQLDRALASGARGRRFESCRAYHR